MAVTLYNDWYISPIDSEVGLSSGGYTAYQEHNANKVYNFLKGLGWTDNAISGCIGNMQLESYLDPACSYPRIGNTLASIDNDNALNYPNNAYGLVQWKGLSSAQPVTNQIVSYAIRYGFQWYDGEIQLQRLAWEYHEPAKFHPQTIDGVYWTFSKYANSTASPETLANVWMKCYEGTSSKINERKQNARRWFTYFGETPPVTSEWITGQEFASYALSYNGQYMPYSQYDCIAFVDLVWHDIADVPENITLGSDGSHHGTNTLWRSTRKFFTTDPYGDSPTNELWWKGTIEECEAIYDEIPTGALLFHQIPENGNPPIPDYYRGDGIGNFAHVGIYCGDGNVMQSGGRDSSSIPGGGVHLSTYDRSAWSHVAFVVYVDCTEHEEPPEPPQPPWHPSTVIKFLSYTHYNRERKVLKNVRRYPV